MTWRLPPWATHEWYGDDGWRYVEFTRQWKLAKPVVVRWWRIRGMI